jgi:hypothetical protein
VAKAYAVVLSLRASLLEDAAGSHWRTQGCWEAVNDGATATCGRFAILLACALDAVQYDYEAAEQALRGREEDAVNEGKRMANDM